jgi:predicted nucleotide-binding protein (sugar kinase/HSP70/actin superfamily)
MSHLSFFTEVLEYYYINKFEKVLKDFRFYRPQSDIKEEALLASKIVSLVNQYGEGWLIPGEVASFANMGINNVLCLQPFGCLANQIIGKGVENRIKKLHPDMNLLFLDFDQGTSELNIINRLYFLIKNASLQVAGE